MGQRKNLTIGVTINLDNYENLRLEVDGEVCTDRDAEDLVVFLDGMIARLGRGDPATAERLDAYRRRVFDLPASVSDAPAPAQAPLAAPPAQGETPLSETVEPPESPPVIPGVVEGGPAVAAPAPAAEEAPAKPVTARPRPMAAEEKASPAATPAPSDQVSTPPQPGSVSCEECGAGVTDAQAKVSQMFMGRTLCKKCMPGV